MAYVVTSETSFPGEALAAFDAPIPDGHQANDILLAIITQDGGGTTIAVPGWTQIGTQAAAQGQRTTAFWRLATSSAEADFSATGATDEWIVTIVVIRGANTTTPINAQLRTDSANSTSNSLASGTVTTTADNCLVIYAWGFDEIFKLIPQNPAALVMLGRDTDFVGCVQIAGYMNQLTAGVTPNITALSEVQSEGGQALVIAIQDATPSTPKLGPFGLETYQVLKRYGGITTASTSTAAFIRHDAVTWGGATSLAAGTIDGMAVINIATFAEVAFQDTSRPWGSMTGLSCTGSALDNAGRWVGNSHTFSATDMTNKIFSLEVMISSVATGIFGARGIIVVFQDGSGNWVAHRVTRRAGLVAGVSFTWQVDLQGATPLDSAGTMDWSNVVRIGYLFHKRTTTTTAVILRIKNALLLERTTLVDGSAESPATPALTNRLMDGWGPTGVGSLQGGGQALWRSGVRYGNGSRRTYVSTPATSYELPLRANASLARRFWQVPDTRPGAAFTLYASANDTVDMTACVMATNVRQNWTVDAASSLSASYDFSGASIIGWDVINPVIPINAATFKGCPTITLNGGTLTGCIVSGCGPLTTNDPSRIQNCAFTSPGSGHGIVITAPGTYSVTGNTFAGYGANATTNAAIYNNSGGLVTINLGAGDQVPTVRNGVGASTTINEFLGSVSATVLAGSRVQLFNVTTATELDNVVEAGTAYSYAFQSGNASNGDSIRLRVTRLGEMPWEGTAVYSSGQSITFVPSQPVDEVYVALGIDGSAVTGFSANYGNTTIERTNTSNFPGASLYAWFQFNLTTANGIANWQGGLVAIDTGNLRINNATVNLMLDNTTTTNVYQNDNIRVFRADGGYPVMNPTAGGGGIDLNWRNVVYSVGGGGGGDSKEDIYEYFTTANRQNTFRADVSALALETTAQAIPGAVRAEMDSNSTRLSAIVANTNLIPAAL